MNNANPKDIVSMNVPFLIRLMEYCREDAKSDVELHIIAEHLIDLAANGTTATMQHINKIFQTE